MSPITKCPHCGKDLETQDPLEQLLLHCRKQAKTQATLATNRIHSAETVPAYREHNLKMAAGHELSVIKWTAWVAAIETAILNKEAKR